MLAYSTVENIGIIALGLGIGLLGVSSQVPLVAVLGFSGALFHVVNHALFKGLLFLGAGAVAHATGTRDLDLLGGLSKRMPWVGGAFIVGAVAIVGLPPLNGFASEFLIYLGAFRGEVKLSPDRAVPCVLVIAALALIGGLAAVCFTKVVGVVFLGEPRTEQAAAAHRPGWLDPRASDRPGGRMPARRACRALDHRRARADRRGRCTNRAGVVRHALRRRERAAVLRRVGGGSIVHSRAGARGTAPRASGWPRGEARGDLGLRLCPPHCPHAVHGVVLRAAGDRIFRRLSPHPEQGGGTDRTLPRAAAFATETADFCTEALYRPAFGAFGRTVARLRWLQHGRIHIYIMYIALTLVVLLLWYLGLARRS